MSGCIQMLQRIGACTPDPEQILLDLSPGTHSNLNTEYGMPSSHSQLIWFFVVYFFLFLYLR